MATASNIKARVSEIAKEISQGTKREQILSKFVDKWQSSERTIDRYMKDAQQEVKEIAQAVQKAVMDSSVKEAEESFKGRILTKLDKQDILRKIIQGTYSIKKMVDGEEIDIEVPVDVSEIMKAIDLDNKMQGDYAPEKRTITNDSPDLSKLTDEDLKRIAKGTS